MSKDAFDGEMTAFLWTGNATQPQEQGFKEKPLNDPQTAVETLCVPKQWSG